MRTKQHDMLDPVIPLGLLGDLPAVLLPRFRKLQEPTPEWTIGSVVLTIF